jgi:hypothetical protein
MSRGNISFRGRKARQPMTVDPQDPYAYGACDGCSFWVQNRSLVKHMAYRGGTTPVWDGLLVCQACDDIPNPAPQFSRLTLQPDPVPVENPRPDVPTPAPSGFGYLVTSPAGNEYLVTLGDQDTWGGEFLITIPTPEYPS